MPVEAIKFCWKFTAEQLKALFDYAWCKAKLRLSGDGKEEPFVTDNGNYILDLYFDREIGHLSVASDSILRLVGVIEHVMFIGMANTVIVAGKLGVRVINGKGLWC